MDQTTATSEATEMEAHFENAERVNAEWLRLNKETGRLWAAKGGHLVPWTSPEAEAEYTALSLRADAVRSAFLDLPLFPVPATVTPGGKVHRVWVRSPKLLSQSAPYCGSARWNSDRARLVNAPVTCKKCLG